jgi:hypothetical protein
VELYYQSPRFRVFWDPTIEAVINGGEGFVEGDELRRGMDKGLELLIQKRSSKWLAEMSHRKVHTDVDQKWIVDDWTPRAAAAGLRYTAFVLPTSVVSMMSLKRMTRFVAEQRLEMRYVDDLEEARRWLKSVGVRPQTGV